MNVKQVIAALVLGGSLVAVTTGCVTTANSIPEGNGMVSQSIVEIEAEERLYEICVRLDKEPKIQYCAEDVSEEMARSCFEGAEWPKCRRDTN